jgi:hypothetical protein
VTIEDEQHLMSIVLMADDQFRWTERLTDALPIQRIESRIT